MRILIHHPPGGADERKGEGRHGEEYFLLSVLMLAPVIASLPPANITVLLHSILWSLLGLLVAVTIGAIIILTYLAWSWPAIRQVQPMRAVAFQQDLVPPKLDTIVIGSGSGGSTCSSLLAQSGQRVLVLEQHPTVTGGCTHSFREQNCTFHCPRVCVSFVGGNKFI